MHPTIDERPSWERRSRPPARHASAGGFSLIELMVTLTIVAVLLAAAAPAMSAYIQNHQLRSVSLNLAADIHYARSEAVKRKVQVVLCRSGNSAATSPSCGGASNQWTTGWLVFASGDTNNTYQAGVDTLLRIGPPIGGDRLNVITNAISNNNLEYNPDGTTNESGGTARFAVCDDRGGTHGRQLNVPPHGRLDLERGSSAGPINCTSPS